MSTPSLSQLKHAVQIREEIEKLESELKAVLSGGEPKQEVQHGGKKSVPSRTVAKKGKRTMSPESRARIVAAQKARWAKYRKAQK
jgi:hypothetical protein